MRVRGVYAHRPLVEKSHVVSPLLGREALDEALVDLGEGEGEGVGEG